MEGDPSRSALTREGVKALGRCRTLKALRIHRDVSKTDNMDYKEVRRLNEVLREEVAEERKKLQQGPLGLHIMD